MKFAPFLLQAFAARVLANQQSAKISRADLEKQGYDVETLMDMIREYAALPDDVRGYEASATADEIWIARKPGVAAPPPPTSHTAAGNNISAAAVPGRGPSTALHAPAMEDLVRFSANAAVAPSTGKITAAPGPRTAIPRKPSASS